MVFSFFINDGTTKIKPKIDETKRTKGIDCQPNNKPIPAINFASPNPMPSIFFITLYK